MKKILSILMVSMMVFLFLAPATVASAATAKETVTITTKDPATGKVPGSVTIDIWSIKKVDHGTTEECVKTVGVGTTGKKKITLAPGTYRALITSAPKGYATYTETKFTVKAGAKNTVTISIRPKINVKFTVLDNKGNPVSNATVSVYDPTMYSWSSVQGKTNSKGVATVKGVVYGTSRVTVEKTVSGERYYCFDKKLSMKTSLNKTISKTINLPKKSAWTKLRQMVVACKPVIYLYSNTEKDVNVKLGKPEDVTVSYPEYPEDGWNVTVHPEGGLTDETGRNLYSLFWEGAEVPEKEIGETGFVVAGKDTASFFEEKLAYLGMNEHEIEEFIIYWLPRMQDNEYNYIRFLDAEEINERMPLEITPEADVVVRIWMEYKALSEKIEIPEQELAQIERQTLEERDFYAIEWGGSEI